MPKVSIIVSVYGVEKYIERCARSMFERTFNGIEYIFVNDCTKDASIEILETIIEDYPNRKDTLRYCITSATRDYHKHEKLEF